MIFSAEILFSLYLKAVGSLTVRYLIIAGGAFLFCWIFFKNILESKKIFSEKAYIKKRVFFEIKHSLKNIIIFAIMAVATYILSVKQVNLVYFDLNTYGWFYLSFSFLAILILHDAYFYWTHRLIHHKNLFRFFHKIHHVSRHPSPFASQSFNIGEGFINAFFFLLVTFLMPIHPFVFVTFSLFSFAYNTVGHLGYEIFPKFLQKSFLVTATHHALHHQKGCYNFGFYFRFWDYLMGTEDPDYYATLDRIK